MKGESPLKTYQASAAAFLLLLILATAFTGKPAPIGIHQECIDQIDNDLDGGVDSEDQDCLDYPFADGNGETNTPIEQRFTSSTGYVSTAYDYWFEQLVDGFYKDDPCMLNAGSWYGPGNDGSGTQYDDFSFEYCI